MIERLTCCVCGGHHHTVDCQRAQRFMAECLETVISPPPAPPPPPAEVRADHDHIAATLRSVMLELDELDRHVRLRWHSLPSEFDPDD